MNDELSAKLVKDGVVYGVNIPSSQINVNGPYYQSEDPRYQGLFQDSICDPDTPIATSSSELLPIDAICEPRE